jgi:predicted secreted acid phosphatase
MNFDNLQEFKDWCTNYYNSGLYLHECQVIIDAAKNLIDRGPVNNPAICFDIDETAISNWEIMKDNDYGWPNAVLIYSWETTKMPALVPVLSLYTYAIEHNFTVFFISSRSATYLGNTTQLLDNAGYLEYEDLILKPVGDTRSDAEFKSEMREQIIYQGYDIVINIGDHTSDLQGNADNQIKLPNPFY